MSIKEKIDSLNELIKEGNEFVAAYKAGEIGAPSGGLVEVETVIAAAKRELANYAEIHGGGHGLRAALEYEKLMPGPHLGAEGLREKASDDLLAVNLKLPMGRHGWRGNSMFPPM